LKYCLRSLSEIECPEAVGHNWNNKAGQLRTPQHA
jgi:hypothetical protein